jgi:hypothetical protein
VNYIVKREETRERVLSLAIVGFAAVLWVPATPRAKTGLKLMVQKKSQGRGSIPPPNFRSLFVVRSGGSYIYYLARYAELKEKNA